MLTFPNIFHGIKKEDSIYLKTGFYICAIVLFVYRISKGVFSNFEMFWQV